MRKLWSELGTLLLLAAWAAADQAPFIADDARRLMEWVAEGGALTVSFRRRCFRCRHRRRRRCCRLLAPCRRLQRICPT